MRKTPTLFHDDGSETVLPTKWVICGQCDGHGKSSAYLGAYTQSEMDDAGPEFERAYFGGEYDRTCDKCDGDGKVAVVDFKKLTKKQKAEWREQVEGDREIAAIERAERAMGA